MNVLIVFLIVATVCFLILFILLAKQKGNQKDNSSVPSSANSKIISSIDELCDYIKSSEDLSKLNILKLMDLSLFTFSNASNLIKDNPQDVREKVSQVYIKLNLNIFQLFTACVYKEYSDDSTSGYKKQIFFYTNSDNVDEILRIYSLITDKFGDCLIMDDSKPFNAETVGDISKGFVTSRLDECHAIWIFKDLTFRLQYHTEPSKRFLINILYR